MTEAEADQLETNLASIAAAGGPVHETECGFWALVFPSGETLIRRNDDDEQNPESTPGQPNHAVTGLIISLLRTDARDRRWSTNSQDWRTKEGLLMYDVVISKTAEPKFSKLSSNETEAWCQAWPKTFAHHAQNYAPTSQTHEAALA